MKMHGEVKVKDVLGKITRISPRSRWTMMWTTFITKKYASVQTRNFCYAEVIIILSMKLKLIIAS